MRRYSPTVMTGEGKVETQKAMETMKRRGKPMLVTNPGVLVVQSNTGIGRCFIVIGEFTWFTLFLIIAVQ